MHMEVLPVGVTVLVRLRGERLETFDINGENMTRVDVGTLSLAQVHTHTHTHTLSLSLSLSHTHTLTLTHRLRPSLGQNRIG